MRNPLLRWQVPASSPQSWTSSSPDSIRDEASNVTLNNWSKKTNEMFRQVSRGSSGCNGTNKKTASGPASLAQRVFLPRPRIVEKPPAATLFEEGDSGAEREDPLRFPARPVLKRFSSSSNVSPKKLVTVKPFVFTSKSRTTTSPPAPLNANRAHRAPPAPSVRTSTSSSSSCSSSCSGAPFPPRGSSGSGDDVTRSSTGSVKAAEDFQHQDHSVLVNKTMADTKNGAPPWRNRARPRSQPREDDRRDVDDEDAHQHYSTGAYGRRPHADFPPQFPVYQPPPRSTSRPKLGIKFVKVASPPFLKISTQSKSRNNSTTSSCSWRSRSGQYHNNLVPDSDGADDPLMRPQHLDDYVPHGDKDSRVPFHDGGKADLANADADATAQFDLFEYKFAPCYAPGQEQGEDDTDRRNICWRPAGAGCSATDSDLQLSSLLRDSNEPEPQPSSSASAATSRQHSKAHKVQQWAERQQGRLRRLSEKVLDGLLAESTPRSAGGGGDGSRDARDWEQDDEDRVPDEHDIEEEEEDHRNQKHQNRPPPRPTAAAHGRAESEDSADEGLAGKRKGRVSVTFIRDDVDEGMASMSENGRPDKEQKSGKTCMRTSSCSKDRKRAGRKSRDDRPQITRPRRRRRSKNKEPSPPAATTDETRRSIRREYIEPQFLLQFPPQPIDPRHNLLAMEGDRDLFHGQQEDDLQEEQLLQSVEIPQSESRRKTLHQSVSDQHSRTQLRQVTLLDENNRISDISVHPSSLHHDFKNLTFEASSCSSSSASSTATSDAGRRDGNSGGSIQYASAAAAPDHVGRQSTDSRGALAPPVEPSPSSDSHSWTYIWRGSDAIVIGGGEDASTGPGVGVQAQPTHDGSTTSRTESQTPFSEGGTSNGVFPPAFPSAASRPGGSCGVGKLKLGQVAQALQGGDDAGAKRAALGPSWVTKPDDPAANAEPPEVLNPALGTSSSSSSSPPIMGSSCDDQGRAIERKLVFIPQKNKMLFVNAKAPFAPPKGITRPHDLRFRKMLYGGGSGMTMGDRFRSCWQGGGNRGRSKSTAGGAAGDLHATSAGRKSSKSRKNIFRYLNNNSSTPAHQEEVDKENHKLYNYGYHSRRQGMQYQQHLHDGMDQEQLHQLHSSSWLHVNAWVKLPERLCVDGVEVVGGAGGGDTNDTKSKKQLLLEGGQCSEKVPVDLYFGTKPPDHPDDVVLIS